MTRRFHALTVAALGVAITLCGGGRAEGGPSTLSCLQQVGNVTIEVLCEVPAGWTSDAYKTITIKNGGTLSFLDGAGVINFKVNSIVVESGGTLQAGTKDNPIGKLLDSNKKPTGGLVITFTGSSSDPCQTIDASTDFCGKGILVKPGGSVKLYGAKGISDGGVSWTHLRDAAGPGPTTGDYVKNAHVPGTGITTLWLARDVTQGAAAWQPGDWIVVATTSFSPFESEFVQIDTVTKGADGTTIGLKSDTFLTYYHFGGKDPGPPSKDNYNGTKSTAEYNYGVDERAEVGLISRSIKLTAQIDDPKSWWGGEIKLMHGATEIALQGVEIEKFGKSKLGAYPIHLHMMGDVANQPILNGNSVHHSYNKCFTIHSTQNVTIQNNVCARIVGHIFYQEIGDEGNTTFLSNLGLGAMSHYFDIHEGRGGTTRDELIKAHWWRGDYLVKQQGYNYDGFNVPNTDATDNPVHGWCYRPDPGRNGGLVASDRPPCNPDAIKFPLRAKEVYFEPPSGFWIINPKTTLIGNSIGGCQGVGRAYWYVTPDPVNTSRNDLKNLRWTPINKFSDNRAHGCYSGLYAESEFDVQSTQLFPRNPAEEGGTVEAPAVRRVHGHAQPRSGRVGPPGLGRSHQRAFGHQQAQRQPGHHGRHRRQRAGRVVAALGIRVGGSQPEQRRPLRALPLRQPDGTRPGVRVHRSDADPPQRVGRGHPQEWRPGRAGLPELPDRKAAVRVSDLRRTGPHLQQPLRELQEGHQACAHRERFERAGR